MYKSFIIIHFFCEEMGIIDADVSVGRKKKFGGIWRDMWIVIGGYILINILYIISYKNI